jgi:hypothetical protein
MARCRGASRPVAVALVLSLLAAPAPAQAPDQYLRVTGSVTNVRESASPTARVLFQLQAGDVVRLLAASGAWYRIESNGREGYLLARLAEVTAAPAAPPPPPPAPPSAPPAEATPSATDAGLTIDHKDVGCVVSGEYPKLDACFVPPDALGRAEVHFRAADTDPWYAVPLSPDGPCHSAFLPKPNRETAEFQYYIDAIDRAVAERFSPPAGPAGPQRVRVVRSERDCGAVARVARSVARVAKPIVVAVTRDPAGTAVAGAVAEALAAKALLAGFSQEAVALATGAAGAAGSSATASTAATGGGGGTGGGIAGSTIAIAGGAAAAAVVLAATALGGGSDNGNSGGGGGGTGGAPAPTPTPTPQPTVTGTWSGPYVSEGSGSGFGFSGNGRCTSTATMTLQQQGSAAAGTIRFGAWSCQNSLNFDLDDFLIPPGETSSFTATISGTTMTVQAPSIQGCPPAALAGPFTATTLTLNGNFDCTVEGIRITATSMFTATKQ